MIFLTGFALFMTGYAFDPLNNGWGYSLRSKVARCMGLAGLLMMGSSLAILTVRWLP